MEEFEDNTSKQADEVEALSAIYEEAWRVEDEAARIYSVHVTTGRQPSPGHHDITLQIELPPDYPSDAPPLYQLHGPWLHRDERATLEASLQEIYCDNLGESIVYLWVERIRQFLEAKTDTAVQTKESSEDDGNEAEAMGALFYGLQIDLCGDQQIDIPCPEIYHGETFTDRKSRFIAHVAHVEDRAQVKIVLDKLKENKKIAEATHNIVAYRISQRGDNSSYYMGCDDDGETKAGSRLLHLLQTVDACDVVVVVTRWYGGIHLGPDRFKHINSLARNILAQHGYIKDKVSKKGERKGTGKKSR